MKVFLTLGGLDVFPNVSSCCIALRLQCTAATHGGPPATALPLFEVHINTETEIETGVLL